METGKIIATLRDAIGWSQADIANKSRVSRVLIGKYERGEAVPSNYASKKIADAFEVSLYYLACDGQYAKFNKITVQRLQDIEALNPSIKDKLFFLIDTVIRVTNAQKAFIQ